MRMAAWKIEKVAALCPDHEVKQALGLAEYVGYDSARAANRRRAVKVVRPPVFIPVEDEAEEDPIMEDITTGFYDHG